MKEIKSGEKEAVLLVITVVFIAVSVFAVNRVYSIAGLSQTGLRALVIGYDCFLILFSLIVGKVSGLKIQDMGLFPKQCLMLLAIPVVGILLCFWKPEQYSLFSLFLTCLGAFSEEVCFRGLLLALTLHVTKSKIFTILSQALLFGLIHYFSYGNLLLCLSPFGCGLIFCTLRVVLPETVGLPILVVLHWINNFLMN